MNHRLVSSILFRYPLSLKLIQRYNTILIRISKKNFSVDIKKLILKFI